LERARAVLNREIERARATLNAVNAETAAERAALADLGDQHKQAQKQLKAVRSDLDRASSLVGLNHDIAEARKRLEKLNVEEEKAAKSIEGLNKQRTDVERQLNAEMSELQALRTEIGNIRTLVKSFG
jgi:chromosome segregation ATPase